MTLDSADQHARTYFFRLPQVTVSRAYRLGPLRLLPAGDLPVLVADADARKPAASGPHRAVRDHVASLAADWSPDATVAVRAAGYDDAAPGVEHGLAIIRLFLRPFVRVNVDIHKIGLADEVPLALRQAIVVHDDGSLGVDQRRLDGPFPFHITDDVIDAWERDPRLTFLADALNQPETTRPLLARKALTAIRSADAAFLARDPVQKVLLASIALEAMLSHQDPDGEYRPQTFDVARRIAYLTCPANHPVSGERCVYLTRWTSGRQLADAIHRLAEAGQPWLCDPFMKIAAPQQARVVTVRRATDGTETEEPYKTVFDFRNEAAHEGRTSATDAQVSDLRFRVDEILLAALSWFAEHPGDDIAALDAEIFAGPGVAS